MNVIGLRRHDFLESTIEALHEAYRLIYRSRVGLEKALEARRPVAVPAGIVEANRVSCDRHDDVLRLVHRRDEDPDAIAGGSGRTRSSGEA